MLQAFTGQSGPPSSSSDEKSAATHVGRAPDQIADALEAEHRVINEEGNRVDAVVGIGRARRDKRAHRAGFRTALLNNLSIFRFLVVEERVHLHRLAKFAP